MAAEQLTTYREIGHFIGYCFGSDGTIWTQWKRAGCGMGHGTGALLGKAWKEKRAPIDASGYRYVSIKNSVTGNRARIHVHRLIAEAFYGPLPPGLLTRHLDGNKLNNAISNIVYGTDSQNYDDKRIHGTSQAGEKHGNAKLDWAKVRIIRRARKRGIPLRTLCDVLGISKSVVSSVATYKAWTTKH